MPEPTLTHASKLAFVAGWLSDLLAQPGFDLGRANLQKFLMRNLLEARIRELRRDAVNRAYQQTLFGDGNDERVTVTSQFPYDFRPEAYAPSRDYDGRFGLHAFRKHFYSRMGDFDSKEEFECAVWLDIQAQKGAAPILGAQFGTPRRCLVLFAESHRALLPGLCLQAQQ